MYCIAERRLYIKANGEIPCWCYSGEQKILFNSDQNTDFVKSVYLGENYAHMRRSLEKGAAPWPGICQECPEMKPDAPYPKDPGVKGIIESIQLEFSFLCNIECVTCIPKKERKVQKTPPYNMPYDLLKKAMDDIASAGYAVETFNIVGRGEPFLNPDAWKMVSYIRRLFPDSVIFMHTNGNFDYIDEIASSGLTELVVSVDGCSGEVYEAHRKNGDVEKVFRLMESVLEARKIRGNGPRVVWKYVMFGHNDGEEELVKAQEKAAELGVDRLIFEVTPYYGELGPSRFLDVRELVNFPLTEPGLVEFRCPSLDTFTRRNILNAMEETEPENLLGKRPGRCVVFGCAPKAIVDSCLKQLSDRLPGARMDLITPHPVKAGEFSEIKLNVTPFPSGVFMNEKTVDVENLQPRYDAGIICSSEDSLFPEKLNVYRLAKKMNCEKITFYTDRGKLLCF